ncbi:hypothetical protein C1Y63_02620 [Corynebacterium sp. 13CS0277]|uniref:hypothetical protein n=1 Tax=Corynebacterium sp. 13CS0277 TaxID=2071994 RepID=UPI000D0293EB|nr:hypothetical protein [Corynebacterium sp. 13CS0277]PRQ12222.1 hypothetical protein C1Y63_02620 [Corynebacterium sp. 13CS0277]
MPSPSTSPTPHTPPGCRPQDSQAAPHQTAAQPEPAYSPEELYALERAANPPYPAVFAYATIALCCVYIAADWWWQGREHISSLIVSTPWLLPSVFLLAPGAALFTMNSRYSHGNTAAPWARAVARGVAWVGLVAQGVLAAVTVAGQVEASHAVAHVVAWATPAALLGLVLITAVPCATEFPRWAFVPSPERARWLQAKRDATYHGF